MSQTKKLITSLIGIALIVFVIALIPSVDFRKVLAGENLGAQACETTTTLAAIGDDLSTRLLATSSTRAWARISQPLNATNTVSIRFDQDKAATSLLGIPLQNASTTNGSFSIEFGLDTDLPYTGSVTGLTSTGSTTIHITQCNYI